MPARNVRSRSRRRSAAWSMRVRPRRAAPSARCAARWSRWSSARSAWRFRNGSSAISRAPRTSRPSAAAIRAQQGDFLFVEFPAGGTGGTSGADGNNTMRNFAEGDISSIQPIEALEASLSVARRAHDAARGRRRTGPPSRRARSAARNPGARRARRALGALRQEPDSALWRPRRLDRGAESLHGAA